jgi:hypothetical protein
MRVIAGLDALPVLAQTASSPQRSDASAIRENPTLGYRGQTLPG